MAYTITGEKCGTVRLDAATTGVIITESIQRSSKVTSNPVERGSDINDHAITDPIRLTITGVTIKGDGQASILRRMWKERDIVEYVGRNRVSSCVITSYKSDSDAKHKDGSSFTIQLQVVNITSAEYVETGEQMMSAQDADAPTTEAGSQTRATSAAGLKTTSTEKISSSAYAAYVNSYQNKAASSSGPSGRSTPSYSAA
jgi:hypothetical protein